MSTGDQSQYVRAKLAERGSRAEASFMEDGFDRWAESTAPAREGQMEKIPAESQMAGRGGAMTLSKAKQKLLKLEGLHGGFVEVPQAVKDAANQAKALIDVWRGISSRVDSFMMELQDQVIDDPASSASLVTFAKKVQEWFNSLKQYKDILDGAAQLASSVGLGKKGQVRGGAMSWQQLADYAKQIASIYFYLKTNAGNIRKLLGMNSLQPEGKQILGVIDPIMKAVGMGRRGKSPCMEYCQCDEMDGGARLKLSHEFKSPLENMVARKLGKFRAEKPGPSDKYLASLPMGRHEAGRELQRAEEDAMLASIEKSKAVRTAKSQGLPATAAYLSASGRKRGSAAPMIALEDFGDDSERRQMLGEYYYDIPSMDGRKKESDAPMEAKMPMGGRKRSARKVVMLGGASCGGKKPSARGAIVKKVMAEKKMSLPEASKYVKEHGLY